MSAARVINLHINFNLKLMQGAVISKINDDVNSLHPICWRNKSWAEINNNLSIFDATLI